MVDQSKEDISDCKGLRDVAMAIKLWPKWAKYHKMAITSVVCNISMQSLVLRYGSTIREFICDTPVYKGQWALPWQPILGLKLL